MSAELRWGLWLHAVRPLPELAALAHVAEEAGASAILVADEGTDRDLYLTLAAIAQHTTRTHFPGRHPVEVLVNGSSTSAGAFQLRR